MEMQAQDVRSFRPGAIAAGLILLALGTTMYLERAGVVDIHFGRLVPGLFLIIIGATKVLDRGRWSGIWMIGVGAWLLMAQSHLFGLTSHNSWPLLVVLGGIIIVIRGFK
jgi:hypothetical protein